ncbi:MAG: Gfo/Idh/MocA family protein [Ilumatobacteraceae bacterium]
MTAYYPPPLRAAIVGTGGISRTHGRRIRDLGSTVVGICGRSLASAEALAHDVGGADVYTDLAEMLDRQRPDVLHVCSPHGHHAEQSRAAIERGIHVVCEKPLAVSAEDARSVMELAADRGVHAAVCLTKRSYPMVAELRSRVAAGTIGEVVAVRGEYLSSDSCHDNYGWGFDRSIAGPSYATADLGLHWLDLVEHVTGVPIALVDARFSTTRPVRFRDGQEVAIDVEDYVRVFIELTDGTPVSAVFSGITPGQPNGCAIHVDGREGGLVWRVDTPIQLVHRPPFGSVEVVDRDPPRLSTDAQSRSFAPAGHVEGFADAFRNLFRDVYTSIGGVAVPYPDFVDGFRVATLIDAIRASAAVGTPVEVPAPPERHGR